MSDPQPRAAVLLVGDELLSGKIRDENGWFLTQVLRRRGIKLVEIRVVSDGIDTIATAARQLLDLAPLLFTSGGVGPTHDDVTLAAVARATDRPLARHAAMETILRGHYGDEISPDALRMADLPEGTILAGDTGWPIMQLDVTHADRPSRLFILPGIPTLLKRKVELLESIPDALPLGDAWHVETVETDRAESDIAPALRDALDQFPEVTIGSYPRWTPDARGRLQVRVRVTIEAPGAHEAHVRGAKALLEAALSDTPRGGEGA